MCACRLEASSELTPPQASTLHSPLEDYYLPYLSDMDHRDDCNPTEAEDLYAQLAQKEHDLILAAELGKALLEKNEELSKKNESLSEEYNQKLEELIQEKHELRLRLEGLEQEYEVTVRELQHDVTSLRHELGQTTEAARERERAKAQVIHELGQQNERLTEQLKKASHCEEQLQTQVAGMRQQVHARRSSMHAHVQQLGLLREEINLLTEQKAELERRMAAMTDDRNAGRSTLEEAQDRITMLEKQKQENEKTIRTQEREISELQEQSVLLQDKVETLSLNASSSVFESSSNSLFNELEMSQHMEFSQNLPHSMSTDSLDNSLCAETDPGNAKSAATAVSTPRPNKLLLTSVSYPTPPLGDDDDDDIECDDEDDQHFAATASLSPQSLQDMHYLAGFRSYEVDSYNMQLKQEIVSAYQEVQQMTRELRVHVKPSHVMPNHVTAGDAGLVSVLQELRQLMQVVVKNQIMQTPPTTPGDAAPGALSPVPEEDDDLQVKVKELQEELSSTQEEFSRLRADMDLKDSELRQKTGELQALTNKVKLSLQHQELQALQAERDRLQDHAAGITRDEIIDQARGERNDAMQKRNSMEVELAQAKLDLMSLDSQLMEAIQQKVALAQQLEQWQDDMQKLIDIQMTKRIQTEDQVEESLSKESSPAPKKRHPFWS